VSVPRSENYLQMSAQEKQAFNEWLRAIVVPSSILALGILALAITGAGNSGAPRSLTAKAEPTPPSATLQISKAR
jgi:energy-converting hydrogenase Eha subunit A